MSKRQKTSEAPVPVVNYYSTTINNYFNTVDGATSAPKAGPPNLFPNDERHNYKDVPYHGKTRRILVSCATPEGTLMAGCFHCTKPSLSMERFAPPECNRNSRNRPRFYEAMDAYAEAYKAGDLDAAREARANVELYRVTLCPSCKAIKKLSPAQEACKDEWLRMRKEACAKNNGCSNPDCVERGEHAWCVLQADHVHTAKEEDEDLRKTYRLSDYKWWAGNGGVEAMRAELAKGINWSCAFCHALEPTGSQANKYEDPKDMPDGKRSGTDKEIAQYKRKRTANNVYPKQQFVDAHKRAIGCCESCKREVLPRQEHVFTFDHRDPSTKMVDEPKSGKKTLAGKVGGVAGLVHNRANAATLERIKPILIEEMDKCRLMCRNCDHRHTHGYVRG